MFNYLGRKKPIVQRLSDLKLQRRSTEERIKKSNVEPTLKDAIPGDITLAMPQKIIKGLLKYLEKLDELMPGIYRGNNTLIYAPEIKFQAMRGKVNKNLECSINNLFLAGDGCGQTGGIVQAGVTGILAAEGIIMKNSLKITLCGKIGSGKSVVAKAISKELNLKHYSTGDLMREIATQKGYKLTEYMKIRPDDIDKIVDEKTKKIGETETNFIFDSKLAFNFIPKSKKIFLDVTDEEAAKRIFENQRESETKVSSIQEMVQKNKTRWEIDRQKYIKMYNVDINDQNNYDIYIDTTNLTLEQVIDKVKKAIQ
jgi:predicted cytidylate kinase